MSARNIQPTSALTVIKSNNANVPFPAVNTSGANSAVVVNQLVDAAKNFVTLGVNAGDIVYNTSTGTAATIIDNPLSATPGVLLLNANIFTATPNNYVIYQSSPMAGGQNTGCVLYVGTTGDLDVTTASGDRVTFTAFPGGSFLPVQVVRVWNTGASANIIALW